MFDMLDCWPFPAEDDEAILELTAQAAGEPIPERDVLPADLEDLAPGVFLAAILSSVERGRLTGHDVVGLLQARARLAAHVDAGYYADMFEVACAYDPETSDRDPHPVEYAAEEIAAALHLTRRTAETELGLAAALTSRVPKVRGAMEDGRLDTRRARVFTRETETLDSQLAQLAVDHVLGQAPELTTGQLRARLARICLELDADGAEKRFGAGVEDRKLVIHPNPDHTASLLLHNLDPAQAILAARYIYGLALKLKRHPGETRTIDQLKADIACDLMQGKTISGVAPAPTPIMVILDQLTGHIPGYGPVLPETLKDLLAHTRETVSGKGDCDHQTSSRRPTSTQKQHIHRSYPTCVFPGCRLPATQCDLDHRKPWNQGGPTSCHNLAPLCRHHHNCKTKWQLQRNPDGSHTWTSPLGHTHTTGRPP